MGLTFRKETVFKSPHKILTHRSDGEQAEQGRPRQEIQRIIKFGTIEHLKKQLKEALFEQQMTGILDPNISILSEKLELRKSITDGERNLYEINETRLGMGMHELTYENASCFICGKTYMAQYSGSRKVNHCCISCAKRIE
jgi:formylmethanofuran dehydrogenase subunit E